MVSLGYLGYWDTGYDGSMDGVHCFGLGHVLAWVLVTTLRYDD